MLEVFVIGLGIGSLDVYIPNLPSLRPIYFDE